MPAFEVAGGSVDDHLLMKLDTLDYAWVSFHLSDEIVSAANEFKRQYKGKSKKKGPTLEEFLLWVESENFKTPATVKLEKK